MRHAFRRFTALAAIGLTLLVVLVDGRPAFAEGAQGSRPIRVARSSATNSEIGFPPSGAHDGNRFSAVRGKLWKGLPGEPEWHWAADFGKEVTIGAILQILGDDASVLGGAPMAYVWQISSDGATWRDLDATRTGNERRMYRIHRLAAPVRARQLRLVVKKTSGAPPAIREVEIYDGTEAEIAFPDWFFSVSSEDGGKLTTCHQFRDLARRCESWSEVTAQYLPHADFAPSIVTAEPRPMCAFFTGSYRDWCEVDRSSWYGVEAVLERELLPMWGACGGAHAFGILSETGCDQAWDCPKCRDSEHPKLPIYGHIGLVDPQTATTCGDYSNNVYEIGPTPVRLVGDDPVFRGLSTEFLVPEYHCGQLEYLPEGWDLIVTKGKGGKTWMQCMRKRGSLIYAAQFHIELDGTPDVSQTIMSNFLREAKAWSVGGGTDANALAPWNAESSTINLRQPSAAQATK